MNFESPESQNAEGEDSQDNGSREEYLQALGETDDLQSPKELLEAEQLQGTKKIVQKSKEVEDLLANDEHEKITEILSNFSVIEKRAVRLSVLENIDDTSKRVEARSILNKVIDESGSAK